MNRSLAFVFALAALIAAAPACAQHAREPKETEWSFDGPMGTFDRAALQRGFQVYKEVCSACHSLDYLSYRNLSDHGGPGFTMPEVEVIAAEARVPAGPDENGEILDEAGFLRTRPALPSDKFAHPYANERAARAANGGALPPDLTLITKAREGGPNYVHSLISGYEEGAARPACLGETPGKYYNPYFAAGLIPDSCKDEEGHPTIDGSLISMPVQLTPDRVTYADGTEATPDQLAHDVATFLSWAAEPHQEARKHIGFQVMIYLVILAAFLYLSYRKIWRNIGH